MTFFRLSMIVLALCIMTPVSATAKNLNSDYPPILDFYPNCSYQVLKQHSVKGEIKKISAITNMTKKLLLRLRKQADYIGADAVIIVDNKVKRRDMGRGTAVNNVTFIVIYDAKLIKNCQDDKGKAKKRTAYNHLGLKLSKQIKTSITSTMRSKSSSFKILSKKTILRPEITNKELSLKNGLYGVKLGATYQQVIIAFGAPNSELNIYSDEKVIGYGRRHWLHFQSEKLVKVQTISPILSQDSVNKIPFLNFFDDYVWRINTKITYKSTLSDFKKSFDNQVKLNTQQQLVIKNDTDKLILQFNKYQAEKQSETYYALDGFTLQSNTYKKPTHKTLINNANYLNVLDNIFQTANEKQTNQSKIITSQFGESLGYISLSAQEKLFIYNNNLLLNVKNEKILTVSLVEEIFIAAIGAIGANKLWHIGPFTQGDSVESLRQYFPADFVELDNYIEIETDEFQLSLLFDEVNNNNNLLYEARVTLYY